MRVVPVVLVLWMAGCLQASPGPDVGSDAAAVEAPTSFDHLSDRLDPASGEFQPFAVLEDKLSLPGGGWMEFRTGRGMHCHGDADPVAPNATGWVACMVRLVAEPSSMAQNVHDLGIGEDGQRLSLRMAAEPVQWRLVVTTAVAASHGDKAGVALAAVAYDSGWRLVDLSPVIDEPEIRVIVDDPCDVPDTLEAQDPEARRGAAVLYVNFTASHGRPLIAVDLGDRSLAGDAESTPYAAHSTFEHGFAAAYDTFAPGWRGTLQLQVDLEAPEGPTEATPGDDCLLVVGRDQQEWAVDVGIQGADGRQEFRFRSVAVEVLLEGAGS